MSALAEKQLFLQCCGEFVAETSELSSFCHMPFLSHVIKKQAQIQKTQASNPEAHICIFLVLLKK